MKYMGEDMLSTEGAKLSGACKSGTVYGHNSGESLKWAPKVHGYSYPYLSGQRTEHDYDMMIIISFIIDSLPSVPEYSFILWFFIYLIQ